MPERYTFYREYHDREKRKSKRTVVTVYGSTIHPERSESEEDQSFRAIAAKDYGPNQEVHRTLVPVFYLKQYCRKVDEETARRIHPRLFAYLDQVQGLSTLGVYTGMPRPVLFSDRPVLLCFWRPPCYLGTDETIALLREGVLEEHPEWKIVREILPATLDDLENVRIYTLNPALQTIEAVKAYFAQEETRAPL